MKTALILPALLLSVLLPLSAYGGTIQTVVTTTHTVTDPGTIELDVVIRNRGDAAAHHVTGTLMLTDIIKVYDELGDNPPGGEIRLKETLMDPGLNPGKYTAVLLVDFEEQNGRSHHAYHVFGIPYRMKRLRSSRLPLSLKTEAPCFNKKAFWNRKGVIRLSMKNDGRDGISLNARLFLPDGFSSSEPNRTCRLAPGETQVIGIPVRLEPEGKMSPYHLVVWCDHDHAHYSWNLKGIITVEEQPLYFKRYLMLGGAIGVILFLALFMRNRPGMVCKRQTTRCPPIDNHQSTIDNL